MCFECGQGIEDALYDTPPEDQLSWLHDLHVRVDQLLKDIPALKLEVSGECFATTAPCYCAWGSTSADAIAGVPLCLSFSSHVSTHAVGLTGTCSNGIAALQLLPCAVCGLITAASSPQT